jgi:LPPG:FO 2-phospho-L-lactate transferase
MFTELGIQPSALTVAHHYTDLLSGFVLDILDKDMAKEFTIPIAITQTLMKTGDDRRRLAQDVLNLLI